MITLEGLRERFASVFHESETVAETILRCTRTFNGVPFAVCYFDVSGQLPQNEAELTEYQDRVVGESFFGVRASLQWNNYLYFVVQPELLGDPAVIHAKNIVERDRSYARKHVITEDELYDQFEAGLNTTNVARGTANDVMATWISALTEAGLDRVVRCDDDLPKRLAMIEARDHRRAVKGATPRVAIARRFEPTIKRLELRDYREFPVRRSFELGTFNLVSGRNGSGKTSFLEAIELFYCGRNQRNPAARPMYEIRATLADGAIETATQDRRPQTFRERSLAWYGRAEVKTRDLYLSFAQFNFLNTDAAVSIAEATAHLADDLARLLIGPDASKMWRDMERLLEAVELRLKDCRQLKWQIEQELLSARGADERRPLATTAVLAQRLQMVVATHGWPFAKDEKDDSLHGLISTLAELAGVAEQATALGWFEAPASTERIMSYSASAGAIIDAAEREILELESARARLIEADRAFNRERGAVEVAKGLMPFLEAGIEQRTMEHEQQRAVVSRLRMLLVGVEAIDLTVFSAHELATTVVAAAAVGGADRQYANAVVEDLRAEHVEFSRLREEAIRLGQELRHVAIRVLDAAPNVRECPLCHTPFGRAELDERISKSIEDDPVEAAAQELMTRIAAADAKMQALDRRLHALVWLHSYCEKAVIDGDSSMSVVLASVVKLRGDLRAATTRLDQVATEVVALRLHGITIEAFQDAVSRLREAGYTLQDHVPAAVAELVNRIEAAVVLAATRRQTVSREIELRRTGVEQLLGELGAKADDPRAALAQAKERLTQSALLRDKLSTLTEALPWPSWRPVAELAVEAKSVRAIASDLLESIELERLTADRKLNAVMTREATETRLAALQERLRRLADAQATLRALTKKHSLKDAVEAALTDNRAMIESIFVRIHAPAEFKGLGSSYSTLRRKGGGVEAKLSEISTGQRAAFALSIFLAQNAQLSGGPAIILVDDPVAHIDDLNCLSFLDYLRETVLAAPRQVVFATADARLASLIERKFDFLGDAFKRIDLHRPGH